MMYNRSTKSKYQKIKFFKIFIFSPHWHTGENKFADFLLLQKHITCETNRTDRIFAFSSFGTLKFGSSTLKSIFSTLIFVFSTFKFVSSTLKFVFDAFQHSEMDAGCVPALWNEGAMNSKIIHCTLNAFFRVLGIWMGCMQLKNRCLMRSSTLKWMLVAFQHSEMRVQWIQK